MLARACRLIIFVTLVIFIVSRDQHPKTFERDAEAATRWREHAMRDEYGRVPVNARVEALRDLESNLKYWQERRSTQAPEWIARGPFDRGGRARALVVHPKDSNILWAAAGSGGLWKSEDAGESWRPIADKLGLPAGTLVMDPRNPQTLYFGTGERFHSGGPGAGIYVTRDGGLSWKLLPGTKQWRYVPAIVISPGNSNIILAGVADPDSSPISGVYRSTDAGLSWTKVINGNYLTPSSIAFQPSSSTRVLLAIREGFFPSGESRIMVSDDAGISWRRAGGVGTMQFTRYQIAYSKSNPQIAYAISREGTFRSDDGGASFVSRSSGLNFGLVSYTGMLWVSPTDPDVLLGGGVRIARSRDGGLNWEVLDYFDENKRDIGHVDFQAAVEDSDFNGGSNRRVYLLNDGGIDRIDDVLAKPLGPRHATSLDHGMQTTEHYAVAGRISDGLLLGAAQDRGIIEAQIGSTQSGIENIGDGACAIIDPSTDRYLYGCGQSLWIARLTPNGPVGLANDLPDSTSVEIRANFIAPVLLDPNKPSRMLAAGASLWRCENIRNSTEEFGHRAIWSAIKPPILKAFPQDDSYLISAVAVATGDSNDIWVAHNNGQLYHTKNGLASTPTWQAIDNNDDHNPLPNRYPNRVLVDRSKRSRVFVAFGGFTADNLWRSDDGGAHWRSASGHGASVLPKAPLWSMVQHPEERNTFIVGSEVGVFITKDAGQSWAAIRAPFNSAAQDITFLQGSSTLLVGTYGRGLWTVDLSQ